MNDSEQIRQVFEKWYFRSGKTTRRHGNGYFEDYANTAWMAWQQAIEYARQRTCDQSCQGVCSTETEDSGSEM